MKRVRGGGRTRPQASPGAAALHPAGGCEHSWGTQRRQGFSAVPREAAASPSRPPGGAQRTARGIGGARIGLDACGLQAGHARSAARARPPPRRPRSALVLGACASRLSLRARKSNRHKYFSRRAADRGPQRNAGPRGGPHPQLLRFSSGAVSRPRTRVACDRFGPLGPMPGRGQGLLVRGFWPALAFIGRLRRTSCFKLIGQRPCRK